MSSKKSTDEILLDEMESASEQISSEDLNEIISNEKQISDKSKRLDNGRFKKFVNKIKLSLSLLKDYRSKRYSDIPWRSIAMLTVSILYFLNPFDMMPDLLPVLGFADDAILFASLFKSIQSDLERYCLWKGLDPEDYF